MFNSCYKEQELPISADFSFEVIDNQYSAPMQVKIINATQGASDYAWSIKGGNPDTSNQKDPGIIQYDSPGQYEIVLYAKNRHGGEGKKTLTVTVDNLLTVDFKLTNTQSDHPPVSFAIANTSIGATSYEWTFQGGQPTASTAQQPGTVVFEQPGPHVISLKVTNGRITRQKDTVITVGPDIEAAFDMHWLPEDDDKQAPFTVITTNNSTNATGYNWQASGGAISDASVAAPHIIYTLPGTYTIILRANNDKKVKEISKTITVLPNTHLYSFTNVALGINTAQHTIGCYFSSRLGRVLKSNEVTAANGPLIDFAYFGLNSAFTYNKIISPDSVTQFTFSAIPGAIDGEVINKIESSGYGLSFAEADFDAITDGAALQGITITENATGYSQFTNSVIPRIVLFRTADGRNGAIKIKQYVANGNSSYINCDIKIYKL